MLLCSLQLRSHFTEGAQLSCKCCSICGSEALLCNDIFLFKKCSALEQPVQGQPECKWWPFRQMYIKNKKKNHIKNFLYYLQEGQHLWTVSNDANLCQREIKWTFGVVDLELYYNSLKAKGCPAPIVKVTRLKAIYVWFCQRYSQGANVIELSTLYFRSHSGLGQWKWRGKCQLTWTSSFRPGHSLWCSQ